jgi:hypothetical protein
LRAYPVSPFRAGDIAIFEQHDFVRPYDRYNRQDRYGRMKFSPFSTDKLKRIGAAIHDSLRVMTATHRRVIGTRGIHVRDP